MAEKSNIQIEVRQLSSGVRALDIHGEITGFAETPLMIAYNQAASSGAEVIILNFNNLEYMNSSGIGLLVTLLIRAQRQQKRLLAIGLNEHYQQIFELTRLHEAIQIYPDEASALQSVGALTK